MYLQSDGLLLVRLLIVSEAFLQSVRLGARPILKGVPTQVSMDTKKASEETFKIQICRSNRIM